MSAPIQVFYIFDRKLAKDPYSMKVVVVVVGLDSNLKK